MGEIAEALRREREEHDKQGGTNRPPQSPAASSSPQVSASLESPTRELYVRDALAAQAAERDAAVPDTVVEETSLELSESALAGIGRVELHRHLALQVSSQLEARSAQTLCVVSALRDEGKTTVAATLAMALASLTSNRSVALIDLDMRNPSVRRRLELTAEAGIESYLLGSLRTFFRLLCEGEIC